MGCNRAKSVNTLKCRAEPRELPHLHRVASLRQRIGLRLAALLGISAYVGDPESYASDVLGAAQSRRLGPGGTQPIVRSQVRWYLDELEGAIYEADLGQIGTAARLMRAARTDGVVSGVLSTRTAGLVRLPRRISGRDDIVSELDRSTLTGRPLFDELAPASELAALAADGILIGVGVGELLPVPGRDHRILVRLDPECLRYDWGRELWLYRTTSGDEIVVPGDGRWVLHAPGGKIAPWNGGLWRAIGRAWITKDHCREHRDNWEAKLANPARVATAPVGAEETQRQSWFERVMAWGVNTVFSLSPGYDVKLLESNGRGADSFRLTIAEQNEEIIVALAGQVVTTTGGTGFANADVHKSIRADLIKATADDLAYTVNGQILPHFVIDQFGESALDEGGAAVEWDVTPPKDLASEAGAMISIGSAIKTLDEALATHGVALDVERFVARFGVPVRERTAAERVLPASSEPRDLRLVGGGGA